MRGIRHLNCLCKALVKGRIAGSRKGGESIDVGCELVTIHAHTLN